MYLTYFADSDGPNYVEYSGICALVGVFGVIELIVLLGVFELVALFIIYELRGVLNLFAVGAWALAELCMCCEFMTIFTDVML